MRVPRPAKKDFRWAQGGNTADLGNDARVREKPTRERDGFQSRLARFGQAKKWLDVRDELFAHALRAKDSLH